MTPGPSQRIVYLALTISVLIWGASFAVAKYALRWVSPLELLAGQCVLAAAAQILWSAARRRSKPFRLPAAMIAPVLGLGLLGQNILMGLTYWGLARTTATNSALIYGFSPVMIALFATLFLREPFGAKKQLGAAVGFLGVVLIVTQGRLEVIRFQGVMMGNLLVFGGTVYWAGYTVVTRRIAPQISAEVFTFYLITLAAVGPIAWVWMQEKHFPLLGAHLAALLAIAFMGLANGTLAFNLWNWGLEHIEASRVGVFSYLEPVFASFVALVFLGERLALSSVVGAALVFAGVYLSTSERDSLTKT